MNDTSTPIRIMLVDDHDVVRSGLSAFLTVFDDFELVGEARDGEEAIRVCKQIRPDVILMDMVMPNMTGDQCYHQLKEIDPTIPVILASGFDKNSAISGLLEAGASGYLHKPFVTDDLITLIRKFAR